MSSPEPQKQTLVPAGLPLTYIGTYAAVGIASLFYISAMMSSPGGAELAQSNQVEPAQDLTTAENATTAPPANAAQIELAPTGQTAAVEATPEPSPGIETKYVTTQQILASRQEQTSSQTNPPAQTTAAITPVEAPAPSTPATSNIVTGSITVPPPPERAPPPPAVIRAALKPAVAPSLPAPARAAPKRPAAPVDFGPAVVTEAKSQPRQPAALAVLLASGSSVESLRLTWNLLQERHSAALLGLNPRYVVEKNPAAPERSFTLLAGPVVSATAVARVCGALVSEGLTCRTRPFGGTSL